MGPPEAMRALGVLHSLLPNAGDYEAGLREKLRVVERHAVRQSERTPLAT